MSHPMNQPVNRLIGAMPKIGIRPAIDGRRQGVRESLEARTMDMAHAVAALIRDNLRHANGLPIDCVIADTCIGGVAEAALCADQFSRENVCATLTVTPCWCYGMETMDMDPHTHKAVWGFNGTERPGAVYLAAVMAAHAQCGLPAFAIYGRDVQDQDDASIPDDVRDKILLFARAAIAAGTMRGKSYLSIGGVSMGIAGSFLDPALYQKTFGMRSEWVDQVEIERRIARAIYDPDEYQRALAWVRRHCHEGVDENPPDRAHTRAQKDAEWERVVKTTLICRDLMVGNPRLAQRGWGEEALGHNAIAAGIQGQRQWTDHFPNHDFTEAILSSSFDWNGIRQPFMFATENDNLNALSMLMGHLLSLRAAIFADVRTYWSPAAIQRATGWQPTGAAAAGMIHLINSGAASLDGCGMSQDPQGERGMKPWWEMTARDVDACLGATTWCPADLGYFRGGGFSSRYVTAATMPMTMIRLNLVAGVGPVLQLAEGLSIEIPDNVQEILHRRTNYTWPTTWFVPRTGAGAAFHDVYAVMSAWGANHCALAYGHIGDRLLTLCAMLRIPVAMHNLPDARIFRPHAWQAFGTSDTESADYRACAAYGPLFG